MSGSYIGGGFSPFGGGSTASGMAGLGLLGGGIGSLFAQNPANSAMQYYNQIPGQLNQIYSPWMQQGQQAGQQLQGQIGQLLQNPGQFINNVGSNFQASPGYGWSVGQATMAANNAAAAGGMAGSPSEQQSLASTVTGLANQNYYNYLNSAMGAYGLGMNSANNMYNTGAQAANQYGGNLATALSGMGQTAYAGQMNQNQSMAGGLMGIGAGIGGLLNWL